MIRLVLMHYTEEFDLHVEAVEYLVPVEKGCCICGCNCHKNHG